MSCPLSHPGLASLWATLPIDRQQTVIADLADVAQTHHAACVRQLRTLVKAHVPSGAERQRLLGWLGAVATADFLDLLTEPEA